MRQFTATVDRSRTSGRATILCLVALSVIWAGCQQKGEPNRKGGYLAPPELIRSVTLMDDRATLVPVRLQLFKDTLYVSYFGRARIDLYDRALKRVRTITLNRPAPVMPTSFWVTDSVIVVIDHARGTVMSYDQQGSLLASYDRMPDGKTSLNPFAVTAFGGVIYASDIGLRRVLAISMVSAEGITEPGEIVLAIPSDSTQLLGFPAAVAVTPDGRLLVGDAVTGRVEVFTCDGRHVYRFDTIPATPINGPQAFAIDGERDPSLQDTSKFNPSGVQTLGRIHIVDAGCGKVHMFNPLGKYLGSYPDSRMQKPSGIAVDTTNRTVYIAYPEARTLLLYRIPR
ncbi:MAG: hypothetical protein HY851_04610 [candidate division Zixibacteria bacterium]|nr:hypothetical protein [candidate division Zixibacteria bacterium]